MGRLLGVKERKKHRSIKVPAFESLSYSQQYSHRRRIIVGTGDVATRVVVGPEQDWRKSRVCPRQSSHEVYEILTAALIWKLK